MIVQNLNIILKPKPGYWVSLDLITSIEEWPSQGSGAGEGSSDFNTLNIWSNNLEVSPELI